jgi:hypothetical protein
MNEVQNTSKPRRFLLLGGSEWFTVATMVAALVLYIFSQDAVFCMSNPPAGLRPGCYHTLELIPSLRWILPLQPGFSIILSAVGIVAPMLYVRQRSKHDRNSRNG